MQLSSSLYRAAGAAFAAIALLLASGCATRKVAPGPTIADTVVQGSAGQASQTVFERSAEAFARALSDSAADAPNTTKAGTAFLTGLAMLNLQCERYLDAVGTSNQSASNERKQVGLVGGLASALMGLTGSSAKDIAAVATTFSFAASSMDSFTTAYLFSDASKSVNKIVREAQGAYLTAVQGQVNRLNYSDTVALLTGYEAVCRPAQIRALIDDAVARGTVVAERPGSRLGDPEVASILTLLRTQFARGLTEEEAIILYAWFRASQPVRTRIEASYEVVRTLVAAAGGAQQFEQKLALAFLPLSLAGSPVPGRWESGVEQILKAVAPQPAGTLQPSGSLNPGQASDGPLRLLRLPVLTVR